MKRLKMLVLLIPLLLVVGFVAIWTPDLSVAYLRAKYAPAPGAFITLADGTEAHVRDQGNPDGLTVLLLHGSNASLHTWEPWVERLAGDYRIITVDLPGHGLTSRTVSDRYGRKAMADFVEALAETLDLERFVLGGNSMGGAVTLSYALAYPDRLVGLLLLDSSGVSAASEEEDDTDLPLAFRLAASPSFAWLIEGVTPRYLAEQGLKASFSDEKLVTEAMIDRYWELARHPGSRHATAKRFQSAAKRPAGDIPVQDITLPTLILWGAEDRLIPVAAGEETHRRMPNSKLIVYPAIGHIPMEEAADRSAADARRFLESLSGLRTRLAALEHRNQFQMR